MSLLTQDQLIAEASDVESEKTAGVLLERIAKSASDEEVFDVFLSHSSLDARAILGLVRTLERHELSVYVDWIVDPELDRSRVTRASAEAIRDRMRYSRSLFFAFSENSPRSKWMPWELGFFDGHGSRVALIPVAQVPVHSDTFVGQEYFSLYPYISGGKVRETDKDALWVHQDAKTYILLSEWLKGGVPRLHP